MITGWTLPNMNEIKDAAIILHQRPYRETSIIIDCITKYHGRQSFICKGVKKQGRITLSNVQPFQTLQVIWTNKPSQDLHYIKSLEVITPIWLTGMRLKCGIYLNKLMYRFLNKNENYSELFSSFISVIQGIEQDQDLELHLRQFEQQLFSSMGYAIPFHQIQNPSSVYDYDIQEGFQEHGEQHQFLGKELLLIQALSLNNVSTRKVAKSLSRTIISQLYALHRET